MWEHPWIWLGLIVFGAILIAALFIARIFAL